MNENTQQVQTDGKVRRKQSVSIHTCLVCEACKLCGLFDQRYTIEIIPPEVLL